MTVVFSAGTYFCVVMACDSAVAEDLDSGDRVYGTGRKWYSLEGVGVVTTWGYRDGNNIGRHLDQLKDTGALSSLPELATAVLSYLRNDYRPHEREGATKVGYHVGGFMPDGSTRVYHVFWEPPPSGPAPEGLYELQENTPGSGLFLQYNGRDDIAESVLTSLLNEVKAGRRIPIDLRTAAGLVTLGHLVLRFARELTFDVGPPFQALAIAPSNIVHRLQLPEWLPLNDEGFVRSHMFLNAIHPLHHVIRLSP